MTREEALNEIKSWDFLEGKEIEAIETLIPELAESEDERIRKGLEILVQNAVYPGLITEQESKNYLAYLEKQKSAEWSEEDEEMFEAFMHKLEVCDLLTNKEIMWAELRLKSLYPHPKQEWSEEDEKILKLLILNIGRYKYFGGMSSERILAFLKSLRPQYHGDVTMTEAYKMGKEAGEASHWKPTEHQMTILKAVKEYVGKGSGYWGEGLGSLIDDLEKL